MNAVEVKNLKKECKDFTLNIKSLEVKEGFITGFIGPNGSGKTTTIKSIMNMTKCSDGEILVFGENILENLKVKEDISAVLDISGFLEESKVKNIKNSIKRFYEKWDEVLYSELINRFKINEEAFYGKLSKGQKKLFELAVALSRKPKILIMDEPTASLDSERAFEVVDILARETKNKQKATIMVTHDERLIDYCDKVYVMKDGVLTQRD